MESEKMEKYFGKDMRYKFQNRDSRKNIPMGFYKSEAQGSKYSK